MSVSALSKLFIIVFLFTVCQSFSSNARQVVTIVADDSYPPYSFLENGEVKGIYVDLIKLAAKKLATDYQVQFMAMPWKRALREVKLGRAFAIIPPFIHRHKRPYISPYSIALGEERVVAYCNNNVDLEGHLLLNASVSETPLNIGVNAGYLILNKRLSDAQIQGRVRVWENRSTTANVLKLMDNRIDCYLNDPLSTKWIIGQLKTRNASSNASDIHQSIEVMVQTAHIGYSRDKDNNFKFKGDFIKRFDKALSDTKQEKVLNDIITKYVP